MLRVRPESETGQQLVSARSGVSLRQPVSALTLSECVTETVRARGTHSTGEHRENALWRAS